MFRVTRTVSLADMLKVYARAYVTLGSIMREIRAREIPTPQETVNDDGHRILLKNIRHGIKACELLAMPVSCELFDQKQKQYTKDRPTYETARKDFDGLEQVVKAEIKTRWFLLLVQDRMKYFEHGPTPFGPVVAEKFPSAAFDIREACKCMGLERDTASVFHAMRVLEKGLGALAREFSIAYEFENWKNIIDQIEKEIRKLEDLPKGSAKSESQQFYSEAATDFRYFKDAWRNHVSHGRSQYEKDEAEKVFGHVKSFMQHLATRLAEVP